jgi:HlyD family secretion protein
MKSALPSWMPPALSRRLIVAAAAMSPIALALLAPALPATAAATAPTDAASQRTALTVEVATPRTQEVERTLNLSGGLYAWQEAIVASELGGMAITALEVDVGSQVKRGQVLARLAQDSIKASLAVQQAGVVRAKAALAEAAAHAERAQRVKNSGALSEQQIQQLQLAEEAARAGLAAAQAQLHSETVRLGQSVIRAADDGVISARSATLGAVVQPGAELFRLVRRGRIEWRAELTAEQLGQVRPGMAARLRLSDGSSATGQLRLLSPTLDASSRKAIAYIDLAPGSTARAGMFGQGEIQIGRDSALTVPLAALVRRDGNAYLYEVLAGDQVELRKVQPGRPIGDNIEIRSGISATARIVARGGAFLNPGDRVRVVTAAAAAAATVTDPTAGASAK